MAVPLNSASIVTLEDARKYYRQRLVGAHKLSCHGHEVTVVFEFEVTHLYSEGSKGGILLEGVKQVTQPIKGGRFEVRIFSVQRARLMDHVLPAVVGHALCSQDGGRPNQRRHILHGPQLENGYYMRVVLRPGPKVAWTCMTAFPVTAAEWSTFGRREQVAFPPEKTKAPKP